MLIVKSDYVHHTAPKQTKCRLRVQWDSVRGEQLLRFGSPTVNRLSLLLFSFTVSGLENKLKLPQGESVRVAQYNKESTTALHNVSLQAALGAVWTRGGGDITQSAGTRKLCYTLTFLISCFQWGVSLWREMELLTRQWNDHGPSTPACFKAHIVCVSSLRRQTGTVLKTRNWV